jgi:hypothetical protein
MTAAPIRALIADRSPTTAYAGASPLAPKLTRAAKRASRRSAKPLSAPDLPDQRLAAALIRRESTSSRTLTAARPIAKSP